MTKQIIRLGGILCAITFIATLLLAYVNYLTRDKIVQNAFEQENKARQEIVAAEEFVRISDELYEGKSGGETAGYCVSVYSPGYSGDIKMIVGFSPDMAIKGIKILEISETPGLGANAAKPKFMQQFVGKTAPLSAVKGGNASKNEIDAISGATITTEAVVDGVNKAFEILKAERGDAK